MQWRARAIGEKGAAAEAKLEEAGPFEGMTVRRAMALVLQVLKDILEDEFSTDRLEMVCVDLCERGGGQGGFNVGRKGGGPAALRAPGDKPGTPTPSVENVVEDANRRDGKRLGWGGSEADSSSKAGAVRRNGLFRRVSKSEIDSLLEDTARTSDILDSN